jgi:hypothetical protein
MLIREFSFIGSPQNSDEDTSRCLDLIQSNAVFDRDLREMLIPEETKDHEEVCRWFKSCQDIADLVKTATVV